MQERPFEDQDKQPEGHGLCLIIVILIFIVAFVATWVITVANEPEPVRKENPFFISN